MKEKWVDCYIDKFLSINSMVKPFVALVNRWAFRAEIVDEAICYDFSKTVLQELISQMYQITLIQEYRNLDSYLALGDRVLFPADGYYLPYDVVNYQNTHQLHTVLINQKYHDSYLIEDDHPVYTGFVSKECLILSLSYIQEPFEVFRKENDFLPLLQDECGFIERHLSAKDLSAGAFIKRLLETSSSIEHKYGLLADISLFVSRFYALGRFVNDLSQYGSLSGKNELLHLFDEYADEWVLCGFLAQKGKLSKNETIYVRIENRLYKLLQQEKEVVAALDDIHNTIRQWNSGHGGYF